MEVITDEIVVCNLGHPAQELYAIKDRPENFYMLGSMGMASSIGLGLALSTDKKSRRLSTATARLLMNLGGLTTIGVTRPKNYVLIVIDNEAYGSTGFQPTFTGSGVRLDRVAQACGIQEPMFGAIIRRISNRRCRKMLAGAGPYCLVIKTQKGMPDNIAIIPHDALWLRDRFMQMPE